MFGVIASGGPVGLAGAVQGLRGEHRGVQFLGGDADGDLPPGIGGQGDRRSRGQDGAAAGLPAPGRPVGAELDLPAADPGAVGVQDADLDPPRGDRLQAGAVLVDLGLGPAQGGVFGQHVEGAERVDGEQGALGRVGGQAVDPVDPAGQRNRQGESGDRVADLGHHAGHLRLAVQDGEGIEVVQLPYGDLAVAHAPAIVDSWTAPRFHR